MAINTTTTSSASSFRTGVLPIVGVLLLVTVLLGGYESYFCTTATFQNSLSATTTTTRKRNDTSKDPTTTTTTTSTRATMRTTALHYQWHPVEFVTTFRECMLDPDCHFLYYHVGKTGGTTIERIFFTLFPPPFSSSSKVHQSCCNQALVRRFHAHPGDFCNHAKFSSYQVQPSHYERIVQTCIDLAGTPTPTTTMTSTTTTNATQPHRRRKFVTFATYREPIALAVSHLHQLCNKNHHKRDATTRLVCQRCNQDPKFEDTPFWTTWFNRTTNTLYQQVHDLNQNFATRIQTYLRKARHPKKEPTKKTKKTTTTAVVHVRNNDNDEDDKDEDETTTKPNHVEVDFLMLDLTDMNTFLHQLDHSLVRFQQQQQEQQQQQQQQEPNGTNTILRIPYLNPDGQGGVPHANTESTQRCNFPMTSHFIKVLQPALVVYRNLTMSV